MTPPKDKKRKREKKLESDGEFSGVISWCLDNKQNLKFTTFADHFGLADKRSAYNQYTRILKKYVKNKNLESDFELWRKSDFAEEYWTKKTYEYTVKKSRRKAAQHIEKAVMNEYAKLDNYLERNTTPITGATVDDPDIVLPENNLSYRLTFDELSNNNVNSTSAKHVLYEKQTTFEERLGLSFITLPPAGTVHTLKRHDLSDSNYLMIVQFKRAVAQSAPTIDVDWSQSSQNFWPLLHNILTYTLNIINMDQKHAHQNQDIMRASKAEFITKYVANFLQNCLFAYQDCLLFRWDICSKMCDEPRGKRRPYLIFYTLDGIEVGCGEIKRRNEKPNEEKEERCRIAEHMKKQLHMRLEVASEEKELATFGLLVLGEEFELSMLEFKEGKYEYSILKRLKLPTMYTTFDFMEDSVEYLLGFFDLIKNTIVEKDSSTNSILFEKYRELLKPTITII